MNKFLPILLVVVLSGCGGQVKSPLENCADTAIDLSSRLTHIQKESIELSPVEFKEKYNKSHWYSADMWLKTLNTANRKIERQLLLDLTLKEKLKTQIYEKYFQRCETERRDYPETFDAKWK